MHVILGRVAPLSIKSINYKIQLKLFFIQILNRDTEIDTTVNESLLYLTGHNNNNSIPKYTKEYQIQVYKLYKHNMKLYFYYICIPTT